MTIQVFIIDDSRVVREATRLLLEGAGFLVRTHDGKPGVLDAVLSARPDLVLVDLGLGDVSGAQVAHDIGALECTPRPLVALYSGEDAAVLDRLRRACGAAAALQKTTDHQQFVADVLRLAQNLLPAGAPPASRHAS